MKKDDIYANKKGEIEHFAFNEKVADVFADMAKRSIPGYKNIIGLIGILSNQYAKPNTNIYDLGCALGESLLSAHIKTQHLSLKLIGVDNSKAMVAGCKKKIQGLIRADRYSVFCHDITNFPLERASVVILNFTLQFVDPNARTSFIQRIYEALQPGGILILSEKILIEDKNKNKFLANLYDNFKRDNGYSDLEISQKRDALEHVMQLDSMEQHLIRLEAAGFVHIHQCFQHFNFISLVAKK